jgi:hypothetical protein
MSTFPTMLYKSPGIYQKPNGKSYSLISVHGKEELDEKLADGWFPSSAEAIEAAGDNAFPPTKPRPKWATKPVKKKKPARPLDWREQAKAKAEAAAVVPVVQADEDAPPTRAELEAKATELGIRFDGRTRDKKLGQLIQDRLSEQPPTGE